MLAGVMLVLAAVGAFVLLNARPAFWQSSRWHSVRTPIFHLLFQETQTIRYALPLVPLIGYLAAGVLTRSRRPDVRHRGRRAGCCRARVRRCRPPRRTRRTPSPIFALLSEMRILQERGARPVVGMHRRMFTESRRARLYAGEVPGTLLPTPRDYEWLELTRAWREGHDGETWFVADPRRTDLALIDREHTRMRPYRWPFNGTVFVGGGGQTKWTGTFWREPGWFLEQGWALTPETAGIADRDGWGPHRRPSIGWVRRRRTRRS